MRDVLDDALEAWEGDETFGLATVVATWRSAPRQPGAAMVVRADGQVAGSVSGGCVEGAVYETALEVVASGEPVLRRFGVSDDDATAVGLSCGGIIDVFVERVDRESFPGFGRLGQAVADGVPVAWCRVVEHPEPALVGRRILVGHPGSFGTLGSFGSARIDDAVAADAAGLLAAGRSQVLTYGPDGERLGAGMRVFVTCLAPRPRMVVFGAVDFAAAVARLGAFLGFRVSVCDARATFATRRRFPDADDVVVEWPHRYLSAEAEAGRIDERTALVVLTHDAKFDVPLLEAALRLPAVAYIGAMGSRRTHEERLRRLREKGFGAQECARIHSPIGLDLGGRTPEETALSIAAEIVSQRWGGDGRRLSEASGPIHHEPDRLG
jgi:xanthine dehydrogenase accessory factor